MSPRSRKEYLETIFLRYKKLPLKRKPLSSTNSVPPVTKQFETLNPFVLRENMERKVARIYSTHAPNRPLTLTIPSGNILL
jgi:hypothetical protein